MRLIDADTIFNSRLLLVRTEDYDAVHAVIERINNAPTVDAEPVKHGHWIKTLNYYENGHFYYQCSQCGYHQVAHYFADEYKYCTNCGAKMDEVTDGNRVKKMQ